MSESGTPEATEWPPELIEAGRAATDWQVNGVIVRLVLDAALAFRSGGEQPVLVTRREAHAWRVAEGARVAARAEAAEAEVERLTEALRALLLYTMHERECEMVNSRPDRDLNPPCTCGADSARIVARALLVGEPELGDIVRNLLAGAHR